LKVRYFVVALAAVSCLTRDSSAQTPSARDAEPYSRKNTFTVFGEYSNDSSHIVLGMTPDRKLAGIGAQYQRRILDRPNFTLSYDAEFRPFIVSSDPAASYYYTLCSQGTCESYSGGTSVVPKCGAGTFTFSVDVPTGSPPETGTETIICSRQQTIAQGGSPIGLRITLMPRRPLQLTISSNGGYMYSTKPIPIPGAGSFNFTFNFGGGLEYFYKPYRSIRLEYFVQHYSNSFTAPQNPGVDSGFIRLAYAFGR